MSRLKLLYGNAGEVRASVFAIFSDDFARWPIFDDVGLRVVFMSILGRACGVVVEFDFHDLDFSHHFLANEARALAS